MLLSGLYFDTTPDYDGTTLKMELHAVVQVCIYQTTQLRYLSEAYSNCFELSVRRDARMISRIRRCLELRETLREQIELPRDVTELIAFHADPGEITEKDNTASVRILLTLVCQKEDGACLVVQGSDCGSQRQRSETRMPR